MPTTLFDIPTAFSSGVNLRVLQQELAAIWPLDLQLSEFTLDGSAFDTVVSGDLKIETSRALTAPEAAAVDALFLAHDPLTPVLPGILKVQISAALLENAGHVQFVRDLDRAAGPGTGTVAYSNGVESRRVADDMPV